MNIRLLVDVEMEERTIAYLQELLENPPFVSARVGPYEEPNLILNGHLVGARQMFGDE